MKIERLTLQSANLEAQRVFYTDVLELPLLEVSREHLVFQAGDSLLEFSQSAQFSPYHFAFNVPSNHLPEAKAWLEQRVSLIPDSSGSSEFFSQSWNANMVYFRDAEGNILEFIARHTLPDTHSGGGWIESISEIGCATRDVMATAQQLERELGLHPYKNRSPDFTAVGDEHGLIITVQQGRIWFPQTGVAAAIAPFSLVGWNEGQKFTLKAGLEGIRIDLSEV